jgi:competence ComEA-like helix-hairpin-helix protein
MARISLRAYNREIENLIDRGHYDQAIAHCRHILKYFNKHIDSYRLLGKAFLESQRYGDAADLFQRVLSSIPDDFVSHVGMSIIREDEGNLDEALWHIERAYEVQPGNKAIQGELRRLYGRRDGMEPPKIQLTRGALARMYLKGELYQQAISELRPSLSEGQQRPDLLVVLARAYYLSGQRVPAADTCSSLLKKYPYCLVANQILADILANSERAEEANVYLKRASALDPYLAHISAHAATVDQVPEAAVVLEKLDWTEESAKVVSTSQPEWATSLGVDVGDMAVKDDSLPEWLASPPQDEPNLADSSKDMTDDKPLYEEITEGSGASETPSLPEDDATSAEIPEWMREAGWVPATGELDKSTPLPDFAEDEIIADDIAPAEMPEWLQEMAPEPTQEEDTPALEGLETEDGGTLAAESDVLPWLDETPPGPTDSVVTFLEDKEPSIPETSEIELDSDESVEIPDWLQDFEEEPQFEADLEAITSPSDTPAGDESVFTSEEEILQASQDQLTEELTQPDIVAETTGILDELEDQHLGEIPAEEIPQWVSELDDAAIDASQPEEPAEELPSEEEIPVWLRGLAAEEVGEPIESIAESEKESIEEAISEIDSHKMIDTEDESDWLREFETTTVDELESPAESPEIEIAEGESSFDEELSAEIPADLETTEEVAPFERMEEPTTEVTKSVSTTEPETLEDDEAFAWLESLAEKQGASEAMLLSPEERQEEPPDWVQQVTPKPVLDATEEAADEIPKAESEALPDWLSAETPFAETESEAQEISSEQSAEIPDWLVSVDEDIEQETEMEVEGESEPKPEGEMPSWIQAGVVAAGAAAVGAAISSSDEESADEQEIVPEEIPTEAELELPSDVDEQVVISEEAEPGIPDWLQEVTDAETAIEAELSPEGESDVVAEVEDQVEAYPAEIPDWIKEITPEPAETEALFAEAEEEVVELSEQPVSLPVSEMLFAPALQSLEPSEPTTDEHLQEEEEEPVDEVLEIEEASIIEGDTAPTHVTPPDQIPIPPVQPGESPDTILTTEEDIDAEMPTFDVPDWLQGVEEEIPEMEEILPLQSADTAIDAKVEALEGEEIERAIDEIPDWLSDIGVDTTEQAAVKEEIEAPTIEEGAAETQAGPVAESPTEKAVLEDDDAFAWLESLAAKQGADEALLLSPEERREEPPEWVEQAVTESEGFIADETQSELDQLAEESTPIEGDADTDQVETALDISDEETIPLEELNLDVPELEPILGEEIGKEDVTEQTDTEFPVSPPSLDDLTAEEIPTRIDGYAKTQPLPDLSDILGEEPIAAEEEITPASEPSVSVVEEEITAESVPELPDWLADAEEEISEEELEEWTPSEELLAQTGALDEIAAAEQADMPLDINKAGLSEFERLPGVGFIKAQAIIEHRQVHGPYTNINDLQDVPGLGPAMVDEIRELITVEAQEEPIAEGPSDEHTITLIQARNSLIKGDNEVAIEHYQSLIHAEQHLPEIVQDLNDALYRYPMEISIWQTLGDAHLRLGQLQEALDSYTKAEELLR